MPSINNTQLGEYVKKTIDKYDWTIRQAALKIGVSPAYLSKLINKKADSDPKPRTLEKLAVGLKVPQSDLMDLAGYSPVPKNIQVHPTSNGATVTADVGWETSSKHIDVYGEITAGEPTFADEHIIGQTIIPDELIRNYGKDKLFALQVNGDSMSRVIAPGFIAVFAKDCEIENGDICAVLVDGENATLKRFRETSKAVILEPESFNPIYKPLIFPKGIDQDFRILGKYVFATSLLK